MKKELGKIVKAELKPLTGKYYGTEIEITDGPLKDLCFKLWKSTGNPSDRELEKNDYTREQLDKNKELLMYLICDHHYESQEVYKLAKDIVWYLNSNIVKGAGKLIFETMDLKEENQKLKEKLDMQTKLVVNLELEKIELEKGIKNACQYSHENLEKVVELTDKVKKLETDKKELHEIIKTLTKNKLPCNPDHNGECLVCDCWLSDCPLQQK
jgi:hypothetical protein